MEISERGVRRSILEPELLSGGTKSVRKEGSGAGWLHSLARSRRMTSVQENKIFEYKNPFCVSSSTQGDFPAIYWMRSSLHLIIAFQPVNLAFLAKENNISLFLALCYFLWLPVPFEQLGVNNTHAGATQVEISIESNPTKIMCATPALLIRALWCISTFLHTQMATHTFEKRKRRHCISASLNLCAFKW